MWYDVEGTGEEGMRMWYDVEGTGEEGMQDVV